MIRCRDMLLIGLLGWGGFMHNKLVAGQSSGQFVLPAVGSVQSANLLLRVQAADSDGIRQLAVSFNQGSPELLLCDSTQSSSQSSTQNSTQSSPQNCGGPSVTLTRGNVDPASFGQVAGPLSLQLWLTDALGQQSQVASVSVNWQPPAAMALTANRSADGTAVDVRWQPQAGVSRYNLYLAARSGVNRQTYQQLTGGQARLAVTGPVERFSGLQAESRYYLRLTGLSGRGEMLLGPELLIAPLQQPLNQPPRAVADNYRGNNRQPLQVSAGNGLLVNDSDADNDPLTVILTPLQPPSAGTLLLQADGSFSYSANAGFVGTDSFTYQISDGRGGVAQAQVNLQIEALISQLSGNSTSMNGGFLYLGRGEEPTGSQQGTGLYRIGDCIALQDTRCTMLGRYTESASSGNQPGQHGNYALVMTYPGVADSPVLAKSVSANSNSVQFVRTGDARFELSLFPDNGGSFVSSFPATPFANSLNFGAFIKNDAVCSGLPAGLACSIGQVGQQNGASLQASLDRLTFTIPGAALQAPGAPTALADTFSVLAGQMLQVAAPGLLRNDSEAGSLTQGDQLQLLQRLSPGFGSLVALGVDEYRQQLFVYPAFGNLIQRLDRSGKVLTALAVSGEAADDFDVDVAATSFRLQDQFVPQGSLLVFNGETDVTEVYALDASSGALLAQLRSQFGNSHVVGGAFNRKTGTLWLLQDRVPGAVQGNRVAEIHPRTGELLRSFSVTAALASFAVSYGDLHINPHNGHLLLVSSIQSSIAEFSPAGQLIRQLALPAGISEPSGLAVSADGRRLWLASTNGSVTELGFANQGTVPTLWVELVSGPAQGQLQLQADGSFSYTPNPGFRGQDSFSYRLQGVGGSSMPTVVQLDVQ